MPSEQVLATPVWNNRRLFSMIWPLIIEQVLAVTMGAADTVMVSSVGEFAVSGVNIVDNINNLLIIAFAALCTGGSVVVSQYIGRRDAENARAASRQLVYTVAAVSLVIMAVALTFRRPLIRLIYGRLDTDVMGAAQVYLLITALSFPMLACYNAAAALFRAVGNSKVTMRIALMVNIFNVGGNALFIFVFHLGVTGAALSTLIGRTAAAIVSMTLLIRGPRGPISLAGILKVCGAAPRYAHSMVRNILNVGIPSGLESSMFQIGRLLTQRIFTTFGTAAIAGNAIASVINAFSFMPGMAYGMALLTVVGQCIGAGDYEAARRNTVKIMKLSYATIFVTNLLIYIFMEQIIGIFHLSGEAHRYAKIFLQVHCISMVIGWPPSFALPNALRAAGDARYVMIVATITMWTIRVSAAYLLCYVVKIGPIGVWLAMGGDFVGRGVSYVLRWRSGKWQNKQVIS
ncbi:MAG: MATE family efflux transporter [Spirochaetaceae bacterium]|jgi:putative MATE family efflux protein|nr:MATE family efflux transporter [Spirochaetaceae bacterium]